ncbi:MAG: hypothetical protein H0U10_15635, partial [Chloroflexia bacterium]|nr:hypothetical protein [Chloroflexia bacterium]
LAGTTDSARGTPAAVADDDGWTLYTCELDLNDIGPVASLALRGATGTPGWRVILVDGDAPNTPGLLNASNQRLDLDGLDDAQTALFLIGVQPGCTAFKAATIDLDITGTRPGDDGASVETTGSVPLTVPSDAPPAVTLESLDVDGGATLTIGYENAPARCGWQVLVTLGGTETGDITIDSLTGPDGLTGALANGVLSIQVPAAENNSPSGTIEVALGLTDEASIETVLIEAVTFP